jgi:phage gp45-like
MNIIDELIHKMRLIVGRCIIIASGYDSNDLKVDVELLAGEKRRKLDFLQQYGLISRPIGDVSGLALFVGGNRANGVVVACNGEEAAMQKKLEPGEVCLLSPCGQQIYLKKDGSVSIVSGNGEIKVDGKLIVTEGIEAGGEVSSKMDVIAFKNMPNKVGLSTHIHVTPAGNSSPPTPGI